MEINGMETYGNLWKSVEIDGHIWKSMEIKMQSMEIKVESMEIYGDQWKSVEIYGDLWKWFSYTFVKVVCLSCENTLEQSFRFVLLC